ncbi:sulfatase-like hydrolase/transferase [Gilliamella sp. Pas-s95]|uniref:sulfatase-like hydrolase/transferase n=1 Tax=Gilliamella sp. Pas-s95 TaxID=2687317 RepID=UPI00132397C9|nr:sulfatase-like hydrolase/transferase [Gilliamella sp. Pas-s95]MWN05050.1 sulfatase-like hydrolase/transferase [Gilliamella sp. Pas-s95]
MKKLYYFVLINIFISSILAIRFFIVPGASFNWAGVTFSVFAVLGHFFSAYLLLFIVCIPFIWLKQSIRNIILAAIFSFIQIGLYIDTIVFQQYRFHVNQSVLAMVLSGQVVDFSIITYLLMLAVIIVSFCAEYFILYLINKKFTVQHNKSKILLISTIFLFSSFLVNHVVHMVAFYYAYSPIMVVKEYIPLYKPFTSKKIMSFFDANGQRKVVYNKNNDNAGVDYPKKELVINPENNKPQNIMFIVLDSWRYDTFSEDISPNTFRFVKQNNGVIFDNHYSTGNATRTGIFGLFYGIPGTYWDSFLRNSIPSLFITTLQKENYNIGIFTSAKVSAPEFDRTAFVTIKNLRISSKDGSASSRDKQITEDWLAWYKARDTSRPTFSFLFYDAPHAYDFPPDFSVKFKPTGDLNYMTLNNDTDPLPIFNRYKQSVYYDDYLLQNVYDELAASGSLDNTILIITGDHSQEMNDNKLGFWGHNGNYTDAQTKVPFIIIGARELENLKNNSKKLTSHEDVVPTLMKHYLYVKNDISDYSTGYDLFSPITDRNWLLMSNYSSYAVRTSDHIYFVNRLGINHYMDLHNRETDETPNYQYIQEAMNHMRYFSQSGLNSLKDKNN